MSTSLLHTVTVKLHIIDVLLYYCEDLLLNAVTPASLPSHSWCLQFTSTSTDISHSVQQLKWERQSNTEHGDHINLHFSPKESTLKIRHISVNIDIYL